jgi:hypothetical protein
LQQQASTVYGFSCSTLLFNIDVVVLCPSGIIWNCCYHYYMYILLK